MLETRGLCKTYKPKKGVPVTAIDHVSLRFPEKGMVFLLGKSGSGKSTMLNLLGGLDSYDDGEIIIKGISSKDFNQQRFDSYRNTYVGFIFQEYNVLEEFTVGANIALALELQGRTANDDAINEILRAVDLDGYGARKPNELSGGQKQRVAIARALVKNPEIIMADEPTGALDSNTGRQILDTLKKLSAEKLVIIVSHDREYAEAYADRIIELADGKVIRDVEAVQDADAAEKQIVFRSTSIEIPPDYHLTEEDRIQINEYLDKLRSGASLMLPSAAQRFSETDESRIPVQDGSKFSLIKSKLPISCAFKIGCSSLKHKRFRLFMTILLSVIAFVLFSLVDTFSSYDHIRACTDSLIDSNIDYVSVNRAVKHGSGIDTWWTSYGLRISEEKMAEIERETGVKMSGIYIPHNANLSFKQQFDLSKVRSEKSSYLTKLTHFCGFSEITEQKLKELGYELIAGTLPDAGKNEIAMSAAACQSFILGGYHKPLSAEELSFAGNIDDFDIYNGMPSAGTDSSEEQKIKYDTVRLEKEMVGKVLRLNGTDYTVTGIVDTHFDLSRYEQIEEDSDKQTTAEQLLSYMLFSEYNTAVNYSLTGCAMVGAGKVAKMIEDDPRVFDETGRCRFNCWSEMSDMAETQHFAGVYGESYTTLDLIPDSEIIWLNGKQDQLADNELIISLRNFNTDVEAVTNAIDAWMNDGKALTPAEAAKLFSEFSMTGSLNWEDDDAEYHEETVSNIRIVGIIDPKSKYSMAGATVVSEHLASRLIQDPDGIYDTAVGSMPDSRFDIEKFVRFCYRSDQPDAIERYELNNAVTYELDTVDSGIKVLAKVFLYIGIGFAIFAALLMANFISTSIHYKRQEIGILRAIGSRSNDVFRIFFSESFVIAMINFVLSVILCGLAVFVINYALRTYAGVLITVLHFGIRQIALLFGISIGIAAIASFLPVRRIAAKKPIDAIRDK